LLFYFIYFSLKQQK